MQSSLPLTTVHVDPLDLPGMDWLVCVLRVAEGRDWLTVAECAQSLGMSVRAVQDLIKCKQLECNRAGSTDTGNWRVSRRSWLVHCYKGWSHRDQASVEQVLELILELLPGLPEKALVKVGARVVRLSEAGKA